MAVTSSGLVIHSELLTRTQNGLTTELYTDNRESSMHHSLNVEAMASYHCCVLTEFIKCVTVVKSLTSMSDCGIHDVLYIMSHGHSPIPTGAEYSASKESMHSRCGSFVLKLVSNLDLCMRTHTSATPHTHYIKTNKSRHTYVHKFQRNSENPKTHETLGDTWERHGKAHRRYNYFSIAG